MDITDMEPSDFCEALAQMEVAAARAKVRKAGHIKVDPDLALNLVRLATSIVKTEIEMRKFRKGFGYKKADDPWAMAMERAEAV